jgi:cytochrome P450
MHAERALRYMPFADGIRTCVGQALARTNMFLMMAMQLSHFSFKLADRVSVPRPLDPPRCSLACI